MGAYDAPEYDRYGAAGGARHRGGHDDRDDLEYERDYERERRGYDGPDYDDDPCGERLDHSAADAAVRHAYYPGRRMNLGVVLLPLRVFLGLISVYAGMGKLCDPVYFDGGKRGSMVTWLTSLQPWALAEPLRDFALSHPVGAGLSVAFLQVVAGVLTVLGLWQRLAACFGALLSAALILTVSWRTVPVYDAPDIIYLAAWSPLIIAGAPVYSVDGRLAGEAWRKLGPRPPGAAAPRTAPGRGRRDRGHRSDAAHRLHARRRRTVHGHGDRARTEQPGQPAPRLAAPAEVRQEQRVGLAHRRGPAERRQRRADRRPDQRSGGRAVDAGP